MTHRLPILMLLTAATVGCDLLSGPAPPRLRLTLDPDTAALVAIGDSVVLTARLEDERGRLWDRGAVTWSSSDPAVATVLEGRVVAAGDGVARVEAAVAGVADTAVVTVRQGIASIAIAGAPDSLLIGQAAALVATATDANGHPVARPLTVAWSSSAPEVAQVDAAGVVTPRAGGGAAIAASAEGVAKEVVVAVRDTLGPTIHAVSPDTLQPGDTARITGVGFWGAAADNAVTVAGAAAEVLAASRTELRVRVPDRDVLPCGDSAGSVVSVTAGGRTGGASAPLRTAARLALAAGEWATLSAADAGCVELADSGGYILSVPFAVEAPTTATAFRLTGSAPGGAVAAPGLGLYAPGAGEVRRAPRRPGAGTFRPPHGAAHLRALEATTRLTERLRTAAARGRTGALGAAPAAGAAGAAASGAASRAAVPQVGDVVDLRFPDWSSDDLCANWLPVTARVVYAGPAAVLLEDTANVAAGSYDSLYTVWGEEVDAAVIPLLREYFGDPLAMDDRLDDDDRLHVLLTRRVSDVDGLGGFLGPDLWPREVCASSNVADMVHVRVPVADEDPWWWTRYTPSVIVHELKHLVSVGERLARAAPVLETSWLEESTAQIAVEIRGRQLFGYQQGDNSGYAASLYCEVRLNIPECDDRTLAVWSHFSNLLAYYQATPSLTPVGRVHADDWTFYASGWFFTRWAADHAPLGEAEFFRALTTETDLAGIANLEARTGRAHPQLLAEWSLALAGDDHPNLGPAGADPARTTTIPSWNTRDIFGSLHADLPDLFPEPWPLAVQPLAPGDFDLDFPSLQGGSAALFELAAAPAGQRLELRAHGGDGPAPGALGLAVLRVR